VVPVMTVVVTVTDNGDTGAHSDDSGDGLKLNLEV
jgi:hypothetical protein